MPSAARSAEFDTAAFEALRPGLLAIARRVLGGSAEADDVVQEAWIRWNGVDRTQVRNPPAFLSTVTRRLALNVAGSARRRHDVSTGVWALEVVDELADPAGDAERADELDRAVQRLLERLGPGERAAFVLREAFGYPYGQIAEVLALTEANARQVVRRARTRLADQERCRAVGAERKALVSAIEGAAHAGTLALVEHALQQAASRAPDQQFAEAA